MDTRILYLTSINPFEREFGGQLRALNVGRALRQIGRITLVYAGTEKIAAESIEIAKAEFDEVKSIHLSEILHKGYFRKIQQNFNLSIRHSFYLTCSPEGERAFSKWASENDLIWFFDIKIPSALRNKQKRRTFIDLDGVRSQMIASQFINAEKISTRFKLKIQAKLWRYREARMIKEFAGLGVCSEADRNYLGAHPSIHVIPNGFQKPDRNPQRNPVSPEIIGFIGTMDYYPNADGLRWFIMQVWPRIKEKYPTVRLRLIGSGTDKGFGGLGKDVEGLGYLKDTTTEIATWSMMVVPIFVGGGTRLKISDGFSRKCPIVSTSIGAYGYEVCNGKELLIADTAESFADACLRLIHRPFEAEKMAERAWKKFLEKWTWEAIYPRIWAAAEDCLRK